MKRWAEEADAVIVADEGAAGPELLRILAGKTRIFLNPEWL